MKTRKAVSVIITTYNDTEYLKEAIESVLSQTYKDYEIIVVDDGSTVDPKPFLEDYRPFITYIRKKNGGVSSARNAGIKASHGKYLAFLDSDDLWLPEKLELQIIHFIKFPKIGLVYTDACSFDGRGILRESKFHNNTIYDGPYDGMVFERLFSYNFVPFSSIVVRRCCLEKDKVVGFDEIRRDVIQDDFDFLLRLARYYPFGYVDRVLMKYRIHGSNLTSNFEKLYTRDFATIDKTIKTFPELNLKNAGFVKKGIGRFQFNFGLENFELNSIRQARQCFISSILSYPWYFRPWLYIFATYFPFAVIKYIRRVK
jgi:glycosyltransferase involved in cell wall biosynthesis